MIDVGLELGDLVRRVSVGLVLGGYVLSLRVVICGRRRGVRQRVGPLRTGQIVLMRSYRLDGVESWIDCVLLHGWTIHGCIFLREAASLPQFYRSIHACILLMHVLTPF